MTRFHPGSGVNKVSLAVLSLILLARGGYPSEYESARNWRSAWQMQDLDAAKKKWKYWRGPAGHRASESGLRRTRKVVAC